MEILRENLSEAGFHVVGAASGDEGIVKARELRPHVITLDVMMPNKDGWQVLYDLKADPATHDIRVIMPLYSSIGTAALEMLPVEGAQNVGLRLGAHLYSYSLLETRLPGSAVPTRSSCPGAARTSKVWYVSSTRPTSGWLKILYAR